MSEDRAFITIAVIIAPVGLKGEVKCALMTDFPERFNGLRRVMVKKESGATLYHIARMRRVSHFAFLTFQDVTSREQAASLRGGEIQVREEERVALPEDHYFRHEVVGLDVYLEEGKFLGRVDSILDTGGNDVYLVKESDREYLIPALKSVVKKIDLSKNEMIICPMEGLLDL
jgi:16S rRNA processing protein RimM